MFSKPDLEFKIDDMSDEMIRDGVEFELHPIKSSKKESTSFPYLPFQG